MSREEEIRNINTRRKNIIFLVHRYLQDNGMFNAADTLKAEAHISDEYELCDNIDLDGIYLEYASYYHLKFGKNPRILRKVNKQPLKVEVAAKRKQKTLQAAPPPKEPAKPANPLYEDNELQVTVTKIDTVSTCGAAVSTGSPLPPAGGQLRPTTSPPSRSDAEQRLQQLEHSSGIGIGNSIGDCMLNCQEWQNLAELVRTTIMRVDLKLQWSDLCGNAAAIEVVKEAVVAPIKYPQLFANGLKPWKSLLVHGPPGSGKTLLAKVLYSETCADVTFFNVTSSVLVSKWRGESEKILRVLFNLAEKHAPSIIFFDEIEGLTSSRERPSDHESSKRFKNELLQLLDGMENQGPGVFVLASTNLPWDIDEAFLRRFERKILVQLPGEAERAKLIGKLLPGTLVLNEQTLQKLVQLSEGFTGDEIRLACKGIAMQSVRQVTKLSSGGGALQASGELPLEASFEKIKPLSVRLLGRHQKWQEAYGS